MKRPDTNSAEQLLASAVANPFDDEAVHTWLECLSRKFPLWSWQAEAYVELHRRAKSAAVGHAMSRDHYDQLENDWYKRGGFLKPSQVLPSAYPGNTLIESVLRDDGALHECYEVLSGLEWAIHLRRAWLTDPNRSAETPLCPSDWNSERRYAQPMFWYELRDDALRAEGYDPDDPQPFLLIGRMLVEYVEAWISAPTDKRSEKDQQIKDLARGVAEELGAAVGRPGQPPEGPRADILKDLVNEGRELFDLCWNLFPVTVSPETKAALTLQGIEDLGEQQVWVARLALPICSRPELLALRDDRQVRDQWKRGSGPYPTPKRLAVWTVAHRLDLRPASVARKVLGSDAKYFQERPNPITEHL